MRRVNLPMVSGKVCEFEFQSCAQIDFKTVLEQIKNKNKSRCQQNFLFFTKMTRKNTDNVCSIRRKTNLSTHRDFRTHPDQFNIPTQQADTVLLCSSQIIIRYTTMCINIPPKYSKYIIPNVILTKPQLKLQFYKHTIMIPYSRLYMISINTIAVHYISTLLSPTEHTTCPFQTFAAKQST